MMIWSRAESGGVVKEKRVHWVATVGTNSGKTGSKCVEDDMDVMGIYEGSTPRSGSSCPATFHSRNILPASLQGLVSSWFRHRRAPYL